MKLQKNRQPGAVTIGIDLSILKRVETGTSVYAENLFRSLKDLDQSRYEFMALSAPSPMKGKSFFSKPYNFMLEMLWLTLLLPAKVRKFRIALIHMPGNTISPVIRIPQVCSIHDAHFMTNPEGRDRLWKLYARMSFRYAARHADHILCDSRDAREEIVRLLGAKPEKIDVIYPGIPIRKSKIVDTLAARDRKPYILSVGATEPNKNFLPLLRAFDMLIKSDRHQGIQLVIAGPKGRDHANLTDFIRVQGLDEKVKLLGHVSDSMLAALYENACLFVFPSLCEGFGFPPLEAMHYGVPVAASNAPCIPEVLGGTALYFSPHDVTEMSERMDAILSDAELRGKMIGDGKTRSKEYSWEKTALETLAVYDSLLR